MTAVTPLHIYLVLTPNVLMLDYAGPAEALRMARDMGAPIALHACGPQGDIPTSLNTGLTGLEALPSALPERSLVLVVGNSNEAVDYATDAARTVVHWLQALPLGTRLASICSGALLLAQAGCLDGRHCTTHHTLIADLQALAPRAQVVSDRIFVDDGEVLTSAGITTGIDLALYLIEQEAGAELAARVARRLVMYQRRGTHDPQVSPWLAHRNHMHPAVHRAQDAVAREPQRNWTLAGLADVACVSPRHLTRLFAQHAGISVVVYQQQLRIARAKQLLAQHGWPVERVAEACGFASARDLRRVWRKYEPGSPASARATD
ncbi:helix-turn-helix domain-containing protein [Rhodoferax sp. TBRC 17660]|uniref:Helix-turn-helix domain-containing protein n=1 Tax=Rhodoferax potami TaxID=3068338 RepID=A0ABU3KQB4_9BURK|nr:helix-turn-helix domain-containing protein [Rhodoferax sp. TBRC 17660]MDT7519523.1 helix-turn-helix domain-containing protein [Rhodoferax sp. TBRC 17660]